MEFGLSSGEDSDEDDTAPAGFEEAVMKKDGLTWKMPPMFQQLC